MRYALSPTWVDFTGLAILVLLPSVLVVGWTHGAPGPDRFSRGQIFSVLTNLLLAMAVMAAVFGHADFGAVLETVIVENDDGTTSEVPRPRANYRTSIASFPFDMSAERMDQDWLRAGMAYLLELDLSQDPFVELRSSFEHAEAARRAGVEDLSRIPRPLQRKIAQDTHSQFFLRCRLERVEEEYSVHYEIYESASGREHASGGVSDPDLFHLVDRLSVEIRRGAGIAEASFARSPDLPVADLATSSLEALHAFVLAVESMLWQNDYQTAYDHLLEAVRLDPTFALAQFNLYSTASNLSLPEVADAAMEAAIQNAYRVPERLQNLLRASYYFHREEGDRGIAVLERWEKVMPDDLLPKRILAPQYKLRGRPDDAVRMYEDLIRLNPSDGEPWRDLGKLYQDRGDFDRALESFARYTELYPESADGLVSLATCYELQGQLEESRRTLDRAALVDPANLDILGSLGDLQAKIGEFAAAEATYGEGLDRARTDAERAGVLSRYRSYCSARAQYSRAIEFFRRWQEVAEQVYPPAQFQIMTAMGYSIYGDAMLYDEGLEALDRISDQLSPPLAAFISFGRTPIYLNADRREDARRAIEEMQGTIDQFGLADLQRLVVGARARLAELDGDPERASQLWRESLGESRGRIHQYIGLGRSLRAMGELDHAHDALEEGLRIYPAHGELNYEMALVELDRDRIGEARKHLDRALRCWEQADDTPKVRAARQWAQTLSQ